MKIHTKTLNGHMSEVGSVNAVFEYAKEILGDDWTFTSSDTSPTLVFNDPTGSGDHGWKFMLTTSPLVISNGTEKPTNSSFVDVSGKFGNFTGVVFEGTDGSVGIGYLDTAGKYNIWFLLIKFDGKYNGKDVYAVACSNSNGHGNIFIHGQIDIGLANQCTHGAIGTGVYLHSLYDPVSGLTSLEVFGPQSMDSGEYAHSGTIVKQGSSSYISVLGGRTPNVVSVLFFKM